MAMLIRTAAKDDARTDSATRSDEPAGSRNDAPDSQGREQAESPARNTGSTGNASSAEARRTRSQISRHPASGRNALRPHDVLKPSSVGLPSAVLPNSMVAGRSASHWQPCGVILTMATSATHRPRWSRRVRSAANRRRSNPCRKKIDAALKDDRQPLSDEDLDKVLSSFNALARAIESGDRQAMDELTDMSRQNALFSQLMKSFEKLDIDIVGVRVRSASKTISATLRIKDMERQNGRHRDAVGQLPGPGHHQPACRWALVTDRVVAIHRALFAR